MTSCPGIPDMVWHINIKNIYANIGFQHMKVWRITVYHNLYILKEKLIFVSPHIYT